MSAPVPAGPRARALVVLMVILLGVAADQLLKAGAFRLLAGRAPATVAGGLVQFRPVENRGVVLGIGSGLSPAQRMWIFTVAECALLAALIGYALLAAGTSRLEVAAVALVAAGGVGNVVDRVAKGFVRDYVMIGIPGFPTAAFNLADVLVVAGAALLLAAAIKSRRAAAAAMGIVALLATMAPPEARAGEAASPHPFPVRMVKLGGSPADPAVLDHVAFCRRIGFNAIWVYAPQVGRWTKDQAPNGPTLDRDFVRFVRDCRKQGMEVWVSVNPVAETGERFVFSDPDGLRRLLAFAKKLRAKAGVTHFVVSYDDQPVELHEFSDIVRYGLSAAPAHLDLVRRLAAKLPPDVALWLCASAYCDAHLGDAALPYAKALLAGLSTLPPSVGMVWTGPKVVSPSITRTDIEATRARLGGRALLLYDNFPVNDDGSEDALALILGALRARDPALRDVVAAYLSCPMTELGGSRLSLLTTAAFLTDPEAYDPTSATAMAIDRLAGPEPATRTALDTQQIEWGGWIDGRNYWPRDALNAGLAGRRLGDPAFVESFTWTAARYPGRMAALANLADAAFRDDLLRAMRRRLVVAQAMPLVIEYLARKRAGRADAADVLGRIEEQRRSAAATPDAARVLDLFLRAADVPLS